MGDNAGVFLMRVSLPDRPGALGAVASAVGTVGADIQAVEIVHKGDGTVIDDFMLTLPDGAMPDNLVSACLQISGVRVLWLSRYPEGGGLEGDIELLERMVRHPDDAAEILTAAAPVVFHCHWALLIGTDPRPTALFSTPMAPDLTAQAWPQLAPLCDHPTVELPEGWLPNWGEVTLAAAPLAEHRRIIVGRQGGPAFLASELARLRHLAAMATGPAAPA